MNLCKDCQHFVYGSFESGSQDGCDRKKSVEPIHGKRILKVAEIERSDEPDRCGPEGKYFKRKLGFFARLRGEK